LEHADGHVRTERDGRDGLGRLAVRPRKACDVERGSEKGVLELVDGLERRHRLATEGGLVNRRGLRLVVEPRDRVGRLVGALGPFGLEHDLHYSPRTSLSACQLSSRSWALLNSSRSAQMLATAAKAR